MTFWDDNNDTGSKKEAETASSHSRHSPASFLQQIKKPGSPTPTVSRSAASAGTSVTADLHSACDRRSPERRVLTHQ